ncbi:MAG: HD domain-containing phosphohydrolase [Betaproteobacteria bacterium]
MLLGHASTRSPVVPGTFATEAEWIQFIHAAAVYTTRLVSAPSVTEVADITALAAGLHSAPAGVAPRERMEALVSLSYHCYVVGHVMTGIEPAVDALNAARLVNEPLWLIRALNALALNLGDTVDVGGAVEYYAEALEIAIRGRDSLVEAKLWGNLGMALGYSGHHQDADECFHRSARLAEDNPSVLAAAYTNLALNALYQRDAASGLAHVRRAIDALPDPRDANEHLTRVLAETYYARLLVEISSHEEAARRVRIARELAARSGSGRTQHSAELAEGLCEVARGQHDIGLSRLNALLDRARTMRTKLRDTLHALIAAYRYMDQPHKADVHVRELSFLARSSQTDYLRNRKLQLERQAAERAPTTAAPAGSGRSGGDIIDVLERLALQAESGEDPSGLHVYRVGALSALLAAEIGLSEESVASMKVAGRLHDIGHWPLMVGLRASPNVSASDPVQERLKLHAEVGDELLAQVDAAEGKVAREAARSHHERWDGLGYPDGLAGPSIPLAGRIVAIASSFDTAAFPVRGRGTQSIDRALDNLVAGRATRFDPELVDSFVGMVQRLRATEPRWEAQLTRDAQTSKYLKSRERIRNLLLQELPNQAD